MVVALYFLFVGKSVVSLADMFCTYTPASACTLKTVQEHTQLSCITDDPLWWKGDEVKLLAGTRLDIAVQEHVKLLGRLNGWRNRLFELQRYSPSGSKYIKPQDHACLRKLALTSRLLWQYPWCSRSVACKLVA